MGVKKYRILPKEAIFSFKWWVRNRDFLVECSSIFLRWGIYLQGELKSNAIKMMEQSKVLNTPGAEKQTKRELFDALRQELE